MLFLHYPVFFSNGQLVCLFLVLNISSVFLGSGSSGIALLALAFAALLDTIVGFPDLRRGLSLLGFRSVRHCFANSGLLSRLPLSCLGRRCGWLLFSRHYLNPVQAVQAVQGRFVVQVHVWVEDVLAHEEFHSNAPVYLEAAALGLVCVVSPTLSIDSLSYLGVHVLEGIRRLLAPLHLLHLCDFFEPPSRIITSETPHVEIKVGLGTFRRDARVALNVAKGGIHPIVEGAFTGDWAIVRIEILQELDKPVLLLVDLPEISLAGFGVHWGNLNHPIEILPFPLRIGRVRVLLDHIFGIPYNKAGFAGPAPGYHGQVDGHIPEVVHGVLSSELFSFGGVLQQ